MKKILLFTFILLCHITYCKAQMTLKYDTIDSLCMANDYSLCQSFGDELFLAFKEDDKYLVNTNGNVIVDLSKYRNSFFLSFSSDLTPVKDNVHSKYGYINQEGTLIIPHIYSTATSFHNNIAVVCQAGKCGIIDPKGDIVIPLEYEDINFPLNNLYPAKKNGFFGLINPEGKTVLDYQYNNISSISKNVFLVADSKGKFFIDSESLQASNKIYQEVVKFGEAYFRFKVNDLWGIMDLEENILVPPTFEYLGYLTSSNLAKTSINKKYGVIDEQGNEIIPPIYNSIFFEKHHIKAVLDDIFLLFDVKGNRLTSESYSKLRSFGPCNLYLNAMMDTVAIPLYTNGEKLFPNTRFEAVQKISNQFLFAKNNDQWFYHEIGSNKKLGPYDSGSQFHGQNAIVSKNEKQFVINDSGEIRSKHYDEIKFSNGYFKLRNDNKWGLHNGKSYIDATPKFNTVKDVFNGLFIGQIEDKFGLVKGDETILPFEYDNIEYNDHLCRYIKIHQNDKIGFANEKGDILMPPKLLYVNWCWLGLLVVDTENGTGILDKKMNFIIEPMYQEVSHFLDGQICAAKKEGLWGFLNRDGETTIGHLYDEVHTFTYSRPFAAVRKDSTWKLIDYEGEVYDDQTFDDLKPVPSRNKLLYVSNKNLWGLIDQNGSLVLPIVFTKIKRKRNNWLVEAEGHSFELNERYECISNGPGLDYLDSLGIKIKTPDSGQK